MIRAQILTWWVDDPDKRKLHLSEMLNPGDSMMDVSGMPAENLTCDPNMVLVECWISEDTYKTIQKEKDYGDSSIFFSEEIIEDDS